MTATSTHDTKLSEDARMRIATLSVFASQWTETVRRWIALTAPHHRVSRRGSFPAMRDEYRFYQALVGMWNCSDVSADGRVSAELIERLGGYMKKSAREAQLFTSWIRPDEDYEDSLEIFVRRLLADEAGAEFRQSVASFVKVIEPVSAFHSLSQLVLKCLLPGVPDFYQGCEDWRFTLTDPDNRRPVDFVRASERLARSFQASRDPGSRHLKMQLTSTLLQFRSEHSRLLREGSYRPLRVRGPRAASVVAFERKGPTSRVVVAVPRLTAPPATGGAVQLDATFWGDTEIRLPSSDGRWSNLLAGDEMVVGCGWCRMAELTSARPWVVLYHARLTPRRSRSL
jgi:(1->4)-alpha-D-glucan 1-alpha-D-glucosylmutase